MDIFKPYRSGKSQPGQELGPQASLGGVAIASQAQVTLCTVPGSVTYTDSVRNVMPGSLDLLCQSLLLKKHKNLGVKNKFFSSKTTQIVKIPLYKRGNNLLPDLLSQAPSYKLSSLKGALLPTVELIEQEKSISLHTNYVIYMPPVCLSDFVSAK